MRKTVLILLWVGFVPLQASAACFDFPENSLPACGFESQADVDQWIANPGAISLTTSPVRSGNGAALVSSAAVTGGHQAAIGMGCFPVSGSGTIGYGAYIYPLSGQPFVSCQLYASQCSDSDCDFCGIVVQIPVDVPTGEWTLIPRYLPFTPFARFGVSCESTATFDVVVDDAYWGEGMVPVTLQEFSVE